MRDTPPTPPSREAVEAARGFLHQPSCPDTEYCDYSWSVEGLARALDAFAAKSQALVASLLAPERMDEREFAGDAVTAWRAYHAMKDERDAALSARRGDDGDGKAGAWLTQFADGEPWDTYLDRESADDEAAYLNHATGVMAARPRPVRVVPLYAHPRAELAALIATVESVTLDSNYSGHHHDGAAMLKAEIVKRLRALGDVEGSPAS